jgi:hypothetical protein
VYPVMAEPLSAGAEKLTVAWPSPAVAETPLGPCGSPAGVTAFDVAEADPAPTSLMAVTVKLYAVPFVSPVTAMGLALPDAVAPPGDAVTVYELIGEPLSAGAVKTMVACRSPPTADTSVGAPGRPAGVTLFDAAEAGPVPTPFVAVTVNVYAVPSVRPPTVTGLLEPVAAWPPGEAVTVYPMMDEPLSEGGVKLTAA